MRKIIEKKVYDTKTATLITALSHWQYPYEFPYCSEGLYRTDKGAFFVAVEGSPMSKYAEGIGNDTSEGSRLEVLSPEEAYQWCVQLNCTKAIKEHFLEFVPAA